MLLLCTLLASVVALELGYGVRVNPEEGASRCVIPVGVPIDDAGEDCQVEIYVDRRPGRTYETLWHSLATKEELDNVKHKVEAREGFSDRFLASCKNAGQYGLFLNADDNIAGSIQSGVGLLDTVSVLRRDKNTFNYHLRPIAGQRSGEVALGQGRWVVIHLDLDAGVGGTLTPHIDVDLGLSSKFDDLDFYLASNGADVTEESEDRIRLDADASLDVFTEPLSSGQYQIGILADTTVAGSFSRFSIGYQLNSEASDSADFPVMTCPEDECTAPERQSCRECTEASCNWCASERKCTNMPSTEKCDADEFVNDSEECPDLDEICGEHTECGSCLEDENCLWCTRAVGADICSPGKDDLAQECPAFFGEGYTGDDASQCPGASSEEREAADNKCGQIGSCTECATTEGCIFCAAGALGNDRCTTGVDGMGQECPSFFSSDPITSDPSECPDVQFCSEFEQCAQCADESDCGWCATTNSCLPANQPCEAPASVEAESAAEGEDVADQGPSVLVTDVEECPRCTGDDCNCGDHNGSCVVCTQVPGCIYCKDTTGNGTCTSGKDDLALECPSLLQRKRVKCTECSEDPDRQCRSNASYIALSGLAVIVVMLAY